ncbi:MAG: hypothetical protein KDA91_16965 [Planctomycetaceae bacterium]|nr:hypothetical protein [Planctomycetaceae bacterium]
MKRHSIQILNHFLMILALGSAGCSSIMHELKPHRLWRLNYHEPMGRTDGQYYSIDDPLPNHQKPSEACETGRCETGQGETDQCDQIQ